MGISGLLPLLKPIHKNKNLSEFSGKTIAVDAYVWLHKGVYACAPEVATGKKTTKCVLPSPCSFRAPTNGQCHVRSLDTLSIRCTVFGYYGTTRLHHTSSSMEALYRRRRERSPSGRRGETRTWPKRTSWPHKGNMHRRGNTTSNA